MTPIPPALPRRTATPYWQRPPGPHLKHHSPNLRPRSLRLLRQHFPDSRQFLPAPLLVLQKVQDQKLGRVVEESAYQVSDGAAPGFVTPDERFIDEGPPLLGLGVLYITLVLEDAQRSQDRVVREVKLGGERLAHFADRRRALVPEH